MALDNPFSTFVSGYTGGQNLQAQRQATSDQQDAQQAAQDAQAAALAYQQGQDTQRQRNLDRAFGAQQDQQKIDNANTQTGFDLQKKFHEQTAEIQKMHIDANIRKMADTTDAKTADRLQKHYQFLLTQGMAPLDAYTQALIAMHLPGNENGPGQPAASPQGQASPFGQAQGQPDLSQTVPTVTPPAPAPGVGGAANPLQTPQINYQTPSDNPFNVIQQVQAGQQAGLSGAPLPSVASKMALQGAQAGTAEANAAKLKAQTATIDKMRDPQVADLLSKTTNRDWHEQWASDIAQQRADTADATQRANAANQKNLLAFKQAQEKHKNDIAGTWQDPVMMRAVQDSEHNITGLMGRQKSLTDTIAKTNTQIDGINSVMNGEDPGVQNPTLHSQWKNLNTMLPPVIDPATGQQTLPAQKAGDRMISTWKNQISGLSSQLDQANASMARHQKFVEAAGIRLNNDGSVQYGGKQVAPPGGTDPGNGPPPTGASMTGGSTGYNQQQANFPKSPTQGQRYVDPTDGKSYVYNINGKGWEPFVVGASPRPGAKGVAKVSVPAGIKPKTTGGKTDVKKMSNDDLFNILKK